jgi:glycosyltransferase involved in cell wall biosynthesis
MTCAPKVPQAQLPREYARADVFVFPTIQDGFGMVLAQANASGLPILTTPNSAGADLVHEDLTGWVLPIRTPAAFAERLRWCASHRAEFAELVDRASSLFEPRSWDQVADDFIELCRRPVGALHGR